jgi:hypothetical protein
MIGLIGLSLYQSHVEKLEIMVKFQELLNEKQKKEAQEKKKQAYDNFKPYVICTLEEEKVYNEKREEIGKISVNTFHTIIFEEDGYGQLFSGEGWIKLDNVIKNPVRDMQIPMRMVEDTPLKNGPGLGYKTIAEVKKNENVEVIDMFGIWYKIRMSNNVIGYVYYKNLR